MPRLFFFFFPGCGVRVSKCARPGGHCRAHVCCRHTHRCPRLAGTRVKPAPVSRTDGRQGGACAQMHVRLRLRAAALQTSLSPRPEEHPNVLPWPLPATSWVPQQSLPCAVRAGVVWVLPDASLVTPGDLRSHVGARPPQTPPRVRFPGMTLSHRPCPQPRKEEAAAGPAPGTILPTHNPGCHQSHRIPTLLPLGLSFPSGAMAGQGSGVSWLAFDGWESKDLPRVKITPQSLGCRGVTT